MAITTSYEAMTGRSLPTDVTSVVEGQPGTYVTGGYESYTPYVTKMQAPKRTPKYDASGKLLGYTVEIYDEFGKLVSSSFEDAPAALAGTKGTDLIKAKLAELQIPASIIDKSVDFIQSAIDDGVAIDDAVSIYYNNKDFTTKGGSTISSPFYAEYTFLRESAPKTGNPPTPLELMQFKMGVKNLVDSYGTSQLYASDETLKKYIANEVKLTDLDTRFATAKLKATEADPTIVNTLKKMGYISDAQGLADFYLDPNIGQQQFEINKNTAVFANQAMKRVSAETGITFDSDRMKQLAAAYAGGSEASAEQAAATGYATIAEQLNPLTKLEGIYNKEAATQSALTPELQKQLEAEQFQGTASELRKKRIEQEQLAFKGQSGVITAGRFSAGSLGTTGISGQV